MLRYLTLGLCFGALSGGSFACDMSSDARPESLVAYVATGQDCLDTPPDTFRFDVEIEQQFERAINAEREKVGLNRLKVRASLQPAARFHSLDMGVNAFFSHESEAGLLHDARVAAFDRTLLLDRSAENVAQFGPAICSDQTGKTVSCHLDPNFQLPSRATVVEKLHYELMQSEGHRANILDPKMTHMSVGVARTDTGFYVTQLFISLAGTLGDEPPLAVETGAVLDLDPEAAGWETFSYALRTEDGFIDLKRGRIPRKLTGEFELSIRAERIVEERRKGELRESRMWIYLSGPRVTILPAKES